MLSGIHKREEAQELVKRADERNKKNISRLTETENAARNAAENLDRLRSEIRSSFDVFADTIEKIQNRPQFINDKQGHVELPSLDIPALKKLPVLLDTILPISAYATTAIPLSTFGTGGALGISALGAAAFNPLVFGLVLGITAFSTLLSGERMWKEAQKIWSQMEEIEKKINFSCRYLNDLRETCIKYQESISYIQSRYEENFRCVSHAVNVLKKTDWRHFSRKEKLATQNTVCLVQLLYMMYKVDLVIQDDNGIYSVNHAVINQTIKDAEKVTKSLPSGFFSHVKHGFVKFKGFALRFTESLGNKR